MWIRKFILLIPPRCVLINMPQGQKSNAAAEALARSRGGFRTKIHVRCEGHGKLITVLLMPGQENAIANAEILIEQGTIRRPRGRLRRHPKWVVAGKGYTSRTFRTYLREKHLRYTIPHR
jgi:hypothetical protein